MHKRYLLASYRIFFSLLTFSAIAVQLIHSLPKANFSLGNFFSYFTIESNILAATVLLLTGWLVLKKEPTDSLRKIRGAATLYMVTTGIVFMTLLAGIEATLQLTLPWVNTVLHYIMPFVLLFDWLVDLPNKKISYKAALAWLIYPLVYVGYSLVRGHFVHWYPYPFLNPAIHGYGRVAIFCVVIAAVIALLAMTLALFANLHAKKR